VSAESERPSHFRPDIEGLRAIAVVAVLLYHMRVPGFGGGFIGVDIFNVISGFLITGLLVREVRTTGRIDLPTFYFRRARRLLPAALTVIVVTLIASWYILSPIRFPSVAGDAAAAAFYVSNIRFALEGTDYLASAADPSPYQHYWSLGVEEQFYLVWPLLVIVGVRFLGLARLGLLLGAVVLGSFALSLLVTDISAPWAFFSLPTRAWQLGAGGLVAIGIGRWVPRPALPALGIAGLVLVLVGVTRFDESVPYPGTAALLPTVGTMLLIIAASDAAGTLARTLGSWLPRSIGGISYSIYLWHWPLLILGPIALADDSMALRLTLGAASIGCAVASTRFIEAPFRFGRLARVPALRGVATGLAASFLVATTAFAAGTMAPDPLDEPDGPLVADATPRPRPTRRPTPSPSSVVVVTEPPTDSPTEPPTDSPTEPPTDSPTEPPTQAPTEPPTQAPTEPPTQAPTEPPTPGPTATSTDEPTQAPTAEPTTAPTQEPSLSPPTASSTPEPTQVPTTPPTAPPTPEPTPVPTTPPTASSTPEPTPVPTTPPTAPPTPEPTPVPTTPPTAPPTPEPTPVPTEPPPAPTVPPLADPVIAGPLPAGLSPRLRDVKDDLPASYADGCHLGFDAEASAECAYGDPTATTTVVLYGDSHAAQWLPALDELAYVRGWRVISLTKSACPPVDLPVWNAPKKRSYRECARWQDSAMERIAAERPVIVFVAGYHVYEFLDEDTRRPLADDPAAWGESLGRTIGAIEATGAQVILMGETPQLGVVPDECLASERDSVEACTETAADVVDPLYAQLEQDVATATGAKLMSFTGLLCPDGTCPLVFGTTPVYRDDQHLTATFVRALTPIMDIWVDQP
jgi:peptidoglycan/LPS O-acetylase OafA/YrhL